ncbi:MAG TPA: hypothetical protein VGB53_10680 [Rubricoccaceae bacterium]
MIVLVLLVLSLVGAVVAGVRNRRSPVVGLLLLAFMLLPLGGVMAAGGLANLWGCTVDESGSHPCLVGGGDMGDFLLELFVSGWFMLLTMPAGAILLLAWLVFLLVGRRRGGLASGPADR